MKIISEGKVPDSPAMWWVGVELICPLCGCKFELERGDTVHAWQTKHYPVMLCVAAHCPTCGKTVSYDRSYRPFETK